MSFAFHAAAPPGEWLNDPNGLVFVDGRYRLFAQHSDAAPDYKTIGWARLSSDDLLRWDWDGQVIAPDDQGEAYSGCLQIEDGALAAYLTRADRAAQRQAQYRLTSGDGGRSWVQDAAALGPAGRDVRDPFVFAAADGARRMLVAEPCGWSTWANDPPSRLAVWGEGADGWSRVGTIGPWSPPGVMWEVPVLLDFGATQVLVLSIVDRAAGMACSVRYWTGRFDGTDFAVNSAGGALLDHGPDFYATCFNTVEGWPDGERVMVGWASNWATARAMDWPGGAMGGPITLPRQVMLQSDRLAVRPLAAAADRATAGERWTPGRRLEIAVGGDGCAFEVTIDAAGGLVAERQATDDALAWRTEHAAFLDAPSDISIFNDRGLIEIFFVDAGKALTVFVPGGRL